MMYTYPDKVDLDDFVISGKEGINKESPLKYSSTVMGKMINKNNVRGNK